MNRHSFDARARQWDAAMRGNVGHLYLEKPAMEGELPASLSGASVLCIGIGAGHEIPALVARGPTRVAGIDRSGALLDIARRRHHGIALARMDMMNLSFADASFDFVYSSLAFHYAADWDRLMAGVFRVMRPGGELLFSTHHPGYWSREPDGESVTNERGITLTRHAAVLPGEVHVTYYNHADTGGIDDALAHAGFAIRKSFTPRVVDVDANTLDADQADACRQLARTNDDSPLFYIVRAVKAGS